MTTPYDVPYMERTRLYYEAQGYTTPYQWAHHDDTPFSQLTKSLSQSRVGLVTTAMPDTEQGRAERKLYSTPSRPVPGSMFTLGLSWHDTVTHTRDVGSFLPIEALLTIESEGVSAVWLRIINQSPPPTVSDKPLKKTRPPLLTS